MTGPTTHTALEYLVLFVAFTQQTQDIAELSSILTNHAYIKDDPRYDSRRLSPDTLRGLLRDIVWEEWRLSEKDAATGSLNSNRNPTNFNPAAHFEDENWDRIHERLHAKYTREALDIVNQLGDKYQEAEASAKAEAERRAPAPSSPLPIAKNVVAAPRQPSAHETAGYPSPSPLAAPVPEGAKRLPSAAHTPLLPKRETVTPVKLAPGPAASAVHRPIQPVPITPTTSRLEALRGTNGASQVLQAPAGVSQSPAAHGVSSSAALLPAGATTPKPDGTARSKLPPQTPIPPPTLKWEKPYQPPHQVPAQRLVVTPTVSTPPASTGPSTGLPQSALSQRPPQKPAAQPSLPGTLAPPQTVPHTAQAAVAPPPRPAGQPVSASQSNTLAKPSDEPPAQQRTASPAVTAPAHPPTQTAPHATPSRPPPSLPQPSGPSLPSTTQTPAPAVPSTTKSQPLPQLAARPPPGGTTPGPSGEVSGSASPRGLAPALVPVPANSNPSLATPNLARIIASLPNTPRTPATGTPTSISRGRGTKWIMSVTPSTPGPDQGELSAPVVESLSPILQPSALPPSSPQPAQTVPPNNKSTPKPAQKAETPVSRPRGRLPRSTQRIRGNTGTPIGGARRSQSVASQTDELSLDHPDTIRKVKDEVTTPRMIPAEDTGDTTADESVAGHRHGPSSSLPPRAATKRKRQDSSAEPLLPAAAAEPPTTVMWTRQFTKVSQSALDRIGSHRHANMFANPVRERDAPNYSGIVLHPQDIASIKKAITHGNRVAAQVAANLPGGDPLTPSVLLPIQEDLIPPKGIINSAQLERELVHMFCNAVMYNPDPDRGPGPTYIRRGGDHENEILGYEVDEHGVVKNTQSMFVEVEKLLSDLRNAESQRSGPPPSSATGATRPGSVATETADEMDELAQDEAGSSTSRKKRNKV